MTDSYANYDTTLRVQGDVVKDMKRTAEVIEQGRRDYYRKMASTFGLAGIYLIPSDLLPNNTFIVSREFYDALLKYAGDTKDEKEAKR